MIRTSIVIPLHGGLELTQACHAALRRTVLDHRDDVEIVYVDNASPDETRAWLETLGREATTVLLDANANFSGGCNRGVAASRGANIVLLNNDTEPLAGWLEPLEARLEEPGVGVVGCLLTYPDGTVQHAGVTFPVSGVPEHTHVGFDPADERVQQPRDMQAVTAACLAVRRDVWTEVDGLDEHYINGMEDVDLCLRVRARGYRVTYEPAARVVHHESKSDGRFVHTLANYERFIADHIERYVPDQRFVDALVGVTDIQVAVARAEPEDGIDNAQLGAALQDGRVELRAGGVTLSASAELVERVGGVDPVLAPGASLLDWIDRVRLAGGVIVSSGAIDQPLPWSSSAHPDLRTRWGRCAPAEREFAQPLPFVDAPQHLEAVIDVDRHERAVMLSVPSAALESAAEQTFGALAGTADELTVLIRIEPDDADAFAALDAAAEHFADGALPDVAVVEGGEELELALARACEGVLLVGGEAQRMRQRSIARAAGVAAVEPELSVSARRS